MAGKDLPVVFHVLADLEDRVILKHGFQRGKDIVQRHLPPDQIAGAEQIAAALPVTDGDVAGLPRFDRERDADKLRPHFIKAGGFGIDGDMAAFTDQRDPAVQRLCIADMLIGGVIEGRLRNLGGGLRSGSGNRRVGDGGRLDLQAVGHPFAERSELHLAKEAQNRLRLRLLHLELIQRPGQRHMIVQRDEAFGNADQLGILHQRGAALGLLDLLGARQKRFQIAVFVDEKGGRLDADPRRTRHVIDAVPGKGLHVHHPLWPDAEFLLHLLDADALGLHRVIHVDALADELHQVLVGGNDRDIAARLGRLPG